MRILFLLFLSSFAYADTKLSDLPLGTASTTNVNDSFPYVDSTGPTTRRLKLSDIPNLPSLSGAIAPQVHGSAASPIMINPASGVVATSAMIQIWWVVPSSGSGNVPVTAMPPIAAGTTIGQLLILKTVADANYLSIPNVSGVDQNGNVNLGPSAQTIQYHWDGVNWSEDYRRQ